jgi:hypothetical protein
MNDQQTMISLQIPKEILAKLKEVAQEADRPIGYMVRLAIMGLLHERKKLPAKLESSNK